MDDGYILRNRVRELRSRLNLRQADLAREVSVTRQTILAIEKERLNPSVVVSLKIARVLREPVGYVFYLDREEAAKQEAAKLGAIPDSPRGLPFARKPAEEPAG
ncbi:MAG: helix-turn-helix domain-containing protein [Candidatus Hydrogenedens sp.]|nr:helix-turn-helix domain-containing protein [Candidatus Hydrogenedens sp.]